MNVLTTVMNLTTVDLHKHVNSITMNLVKPCIYRSQTIVPSHMHMCPYHPHIISTLVHDNYS